MLGFIISLLYLLSSVAYGDGCSDVINTWQPARDFSNLTYFRQEFIDGVHEQIVYCQAEGRFTPEQASLYTTENFNEIVQRGFQSEYNRFINSYNLGMSSNYEQLTNLASRAGIQAPAQRLGSSEANVRATCPARDFRSRMPPIKDQGTVGWCYGYAAADIVSFRTGQDVSALDASIVGNLENQVDRDAQTPSAQQASNQLSSPLFTEGGYVSDSLNMLNQLGYCRESDFPSNDISPSLFALDEIRQLSASPRLRPLAGNFGEVAENYVLQAAPGLNSNSVEDVLSGRSMEGYLARINSNACVSRVNFDAKIEEIITRNDIEIFQNINQQLTSGNIVAVTYNSNVLTSFDWNDEINHASTVVGQRFNEETKECEFLLRNTWGRNCGQLRTGLNCETDGHVWIPAYDLSSAAETVTYAH